MRICETTPVQYPHDDDALVCLRTSSSVKSPLSFIAFTIAPLHTPLQPHTSASGAIEAARFSPRWPPSPRFDSPNISLSRICATLLPSRRSLKYHEPSTVSPYITAPTSFSSLMTRRL